MPTTLKPEMEAQIESLAERLALTPRCSLTGAANGLG